MKKLILSAVVATAAVFGAYTANQTSNEVAMNDLQVENIEALGDGSDGENKSPCPPEATFSSVQVDWYGNDIYYMPCGACPHMRAARYLFIRCDGLVLMNPNQR